MRELPEGWELKPLSEISEVNPTLNVPVPEEVSFIPMGSISEVTGVADTSHVRKSSEVSKGYTSFREGDLIFAKITPCMENGKMAISEGLVNGVGYGSTEFHVLRFNAGTMPRFYYYFLRQERIRKFAESRMTGSAGQRRVPASFFDQLMAPVPPLDTQRKIVAILDKAEEARRLRARANELTQTLLQSVFLEMFGDPALNPNKWPFVNLGDVTNLIAGYGFELREYCSSGIRLLRINNVTFGEIIWDQIAYLPSSYVEKYPNLILKENDILIALNRPILDGRLKVGILECEDAPAILYQRVGKIQLSEKIIDRLYLFQLMQTEYFIRQIYSRLSGSDQPYINTTALVEIPIPLPPITIQKEFSTIVEKVRALKRDQLTNTDYSSEFYNALLVRAFSGELVA